MESILAAAVEAARSAGEILKSYFKADYQIRDKGFHNPVTTADYASNEYLEQQLREAYPDYGWLSEETTDTDERLNKDRVWVVDPLDGTKEFIEGVPHFVVSVALVEEGRPVLGVLHNPISGETFSAYAGGGAHFNGEPIRVSPQEQLAQAEILNSRTETRRGLWKPYEGHFRRLTPIGSVAYKLGLAAAARGDLFVTLRPKNEWDVCAGDCILSEAGGQLLCLTGDQLRYNQKQVLIKPGLVAGNAALCRAFLELYNNSPR
ncbi:MAG: 3'(2'),5'-bisphosphate nucleotidase CysQ [Candidatus Marinimicrobia bacterium]|nr:3'(2'),5'-bisphosphate nucleotidase CysQ [Candidatus Neomarinimicrobiota bacterium]